MRLNKIYIVEVYEKKITNPSWSNDFCYDIIMKVSYKGREYIRRKIYPKEKWNLIYKQGFEYI